MGLNCPNILPIFQNANVILFTIALIFLSLLQICYLLAPGGTVELEQKSKLAQEYHFANTRSNPALDKLVSNFYNNNFEQTNIHNRRKWDGSIEKLVAEGLKVIKLGIQQQRQNS